MARIGILVSTPIKSNLAELIAAGEDPRRDYLELRDMLGAELISPPAQAGFLYSALRKVGGTAVAMAYVAWVWRRNYDIIVTDQEAAGLVLALIFKLTRTQRGHLMISHYLTPAKKQILYCLLRAQTHIDITICYSSAQAAVARKKLRLNPDQVSLVLHPADNQFWRPAVGDEEIDRDRQLLRQAGVYLPEHVQVVCSAGLEFRDYDTLMKTARRLPQGVQLVIAAASPWSKRKNMAEDIQLPKNTQRVTLTPLQLRALYRRAQAVAIPLYDVDFQAGSLVAYEAMACGKPVVITRTRGQRDIVREGVTGLYVPPGDADAMLNALGQLLSDPARSRSFGEEARSVVDRNLNLDAYLATMVELVHRVAARYSTDEQPGDKQIATSKQVVE